MMSAILSGVAFREAAESEVHVGGNGQGAPGAASKDKPLPETVKMEDGREVLFTPKKKMLKESFVNTETNEVSVRLDFRNGAVRNFNVTGSGLLLQFAAHGAEQKLGDELAGEEGDIDDFVMTIDALIARLDKGEWSTKREGGFGGASILIKALLQFAETQGKTKTQEEVAAFVKAKTPAERTALKNSAKIKPIVDALEAERVAKAGKVNTDELLAGL